MAHSGSAAALDVGNMTNLASIADGKQPPETVNEAHAQPRQERGFGAAMTARGRVQRPLSEEESGRSIQPVGHEVDMGRGNEAGRRHGRRHGSDGKRRRRQRCTHATRRAGAAFDLREFVQMVGRREVVRATVADRLVMVVSNARHVLVLPDSRVTMTSVRLGRCGDQQPMVVRTTVEHGRGREALQGQREQQQPHQRGTKSEDHLRSVDRFEKAGLRATWSAGHTPRRKRGQSAASA